MKKIKKRWPAVWTGQQQSEGLCEGRVRPPVWIKSNGATYDVRGSTWTVCMTSEGELSPQQGLGRPGSGGCGHWEACGRVQETVSGVRLLDSSTGRHRGATGVRT